jgi:Gram-negative bacterial TonB protein C-terminal
MPEISTSDVKVADSARTAQPTVLEVPVTIQGSKPVEGQEKRELFTETTKTTLVFANGAVVNLASRLLAGQCVFVRNENSGREILCKVLESRPAGPTNYTDLEFTAHDPNFWDAPAIPSTKTVQPAEAVEPASPITPTQPILIVQPEHVNESDPRSEAQRKIDAAVAGLSSTEMMESSASAVENLPAPVIEDTEEEPAAPAPETPEVMSNHEPAPVPEHALEDSSDHPREQENIPELDDAEVAGHLATLIAMDDKPKSHRETASGVTKEAQPNVPPEQPSQQDVTSAPARTRAAAISTLELRLRTLPFIGALKKPAVIGIAASVLMVATVGIAWRVKHNLSIRNTKGLSAASSTVKQPAQPATTQTPASTMGPGSVASGQAAEKSPQPNGTQAGPGSAMGQNSATNADAHGPVAGSNAANKAGGPAVISVKASIPGSNRVVLAKPKQRKESATASLEIVPPKIVSQSQPGIPTWAQGIDTDGVVKLDALIDEKGNVTETKPLSGPRALQREAQRVVALWVFEPAMEGGKPTATHMVLTVQFQM